MLANRTVTAALTISVALGSAARDVAAAWNEGVARDGNAQAPRITGIRIPGAKVLIDTQERLDSFTAALRADGFLPTQRSGAPFRVIEICAGPAVGPLSNDALLRATLDRVFAARLISAIRGVELGRVVTDGSEATLVRVFVSPEAPAEPTKTDSLIAVRRLQQRGFGLEARLLAETLERNGGLGGEERAVLGFSRYEKRPINLDATIEPAVLRAYADIAGELCREDELEWRVGAAVFSSLLEDFDRRVSKLAAQGDALSPEAVSRAVRESLESALRFEFDENLHVTVPSALASGDVDCVTLSLLSEALLARTKIEAKPIGFIHAPNRLSSAPVGHMVLELPSTGTEKRLFDPLAPLGDLFYSAVDPRVLGEAPVSRDDLRAERVYRMVLRRELRAGHVAKTAVVKAAEAGLAISPKYWLLLTNAGKFEEARLNAPGKNGAILEYISAKENPRK